MSPQAIVVTLAIVTVMALVVSYAIWQHRPRTGATYLAVSTLGIGLWGVGDAAALVIQGDGGAVSAAYIATGGAVVSAVCWTHFGAIYTGRDGWLTRRRSTILWAIPIVLFLGGVVRPSAYLSPDGASIGSLTFAPGPLYVSLIAYGYLAQSAGTVLLVGKLQRSRNVYRQRTFLFVLIGSVLLAGHVASVAGLSPFPNTALGPLSFVGLGVISGLVLYDDTFLALLPIERVYGLFGDRFEDLGPIARDAVIEEMGSGVVVLDANNRIVDLNPVARRMLGATDDRIVGERIDSILDQDVFEAEDLPFLGPDIREGRFDGVWVQSPDGERRCYDIVISNLDGRGDDVSGRVAIIHDVTEKQRQQQRLEAQTLKLKRQNENLEEFATIVSHDLRNPLTVATGHVEYAYETGETARLEAAMRAHDRIEHIISDVLQLARQGRTVDETEPVSITEAATAAWESVETAGASLDLDVSEDVTVEADASRLQQVFENLFRNAIEHANAAQGSGVSPDTVADGGPADSSTVTVRLGLTADGFFVEDDGPGIPEDERESVFVEGYTTDESGTGLGLAIVSMIVDAHGWDIALAESDSGGARFEIDVE
ncbi:histidine kinase N-terminal 7TM domain-containing protein [Halapricum salinum]|uniref:histidine kinase n=1 Tax=Halapricum salinum TaxID=1457250 RepID=A0A4D6HI28_9EURY|nr:histidine kinase N-terminal 7TM domain-containing protein [Halapricum salinum]QCC52672.1 PAS domain-containing sensor histidine kinase [Halapricum salinum]